jgi:peptidoglycan/LPS O-acetylase OafA/YrhL
MTFPDGLRAIASLVVVLPHAVGLLVVSPRQNRFDALAVVVAKHGTIGVQIFFVLSGFVIAFSIGRQFITARYLGVFILRRSVRLDSPYWCAIALAGAFILFRAHVSPAHVIVPSASNIVAHLFYLQNILHTPEINVVFWTLCLEVQLYSLFVPFLHYPRGYIFGSKCPSRFR